MLFWIDGLAKEDFSQNFGPYIVSNFFSSSAFTTTLQACLKGKIKPSLMVH